MIQDLMRNWEIFLGAVDVSIRILGLVLSSKEGREFVHALGPGDAGLCLELLDRGLRESLLDRETSLPALISLASRHKRFPSSFVITSGIDVSGRVIASGGFADIRPARYGDREVVVRTLRVALMDDTEKTWNRFCREVVIWNSLTHKNILKFVGVLGDVSSPKLSTMTDFMTHGNIMQYIKNHHCNRLELLHGAAEGLKYIHAVNLAHADLKAANILITSEDPPRACLADFGFTTVIPGSSWDPLLFPAIEGGGTFAFMAPELLSPAKFGLNGSIPTREADIFAFGLVVFQVLTGIPPFSYTKSTHACEIVKGTRPRRPANSESIGLSDPLWMFVQACWDEDRAKRPQVQEVVDHIGDAAVNWNELMPPPPSDLTFDGGRGTGRHQSEEEKFYSTALTYPSVADQGAPRPFHDQSIRGSAADDCGRDTAAGVVIPLSPPHEARSPHVPRPLDHSVLWEKVTGLSDDVGRIRALAEMLSSSQGRHFVSRSDCIDVNFCLEVLDRGLAENKLPWDEKQPFFLTLRRLAGRHGRLPASMTITEKVQIPDQIQISGGFADIRKGFYKGCPVAVKTLRVSPADNLDKIRKQFCKEVILWNSISHPNILKLVGVLGGIDQSDFSTISEWMQHGNIVEYIKDGHGNVNRMDLLHGAAKGLKYLHEMNIVHGDLKGTNIFITNETPPQACLADFGFMTMPLDPQNPLSCSAELGGGTTWFMSPELLDPSKFGMDSAVPTRESDIYAFGLVIFQVLTGEMPFCHLREHEAELAIVDGKQPEKPRDAPAIGFSDSLWRFSQLCWSCDRRVRPKVEEVVAQIGTAASSWTSDAPARPAGPEVHLEANLHSPPSSLPLVLRYNAARVQRSRPLGHVMTTRRGSPGVSLPASPSSSSPGNSSTPTHRPLSDTLRRSNKRYSEPLPQASLGSAAADG